MYRFEGGNAFLHLLQSKRFVINLFPFFQEEDKKIEEKQKNELKGLPPDNHFNLVCLKKWEDDIIWSSEDYKPKENSAALRSLAGWIPSGNIRTMQAYLAQFANKGRTIYMYYFKDENCHLMNERKGW